MPTMIDCPGCNESLPVTEATRATAIECPFCAHEFTAFEELGNGRAAAAATRAKKAKRRRDDNDDDDDDDESGQSNPKRGAGGAGMMVIVVGGIGLFSVIVAIGLVTWLIVTYDPNEHTRPNRNTVNAPNPNRTHTPNRPGVPDDDDTDDPNPNPRPQPQPQPKPQPKPKKETFALRPVNAARASIIPPKGLTPAGQTIVALPGRAGEVLVGGGGRYLVIHVPDRRKLVLFDVNQAALVTEHNLDADPDPVFAAGSNTMVVIYPGRKVMQALTLPTLQVESSGPVPAVPGQTRVLGAGLGAATNGPLYVVGEVDAWPHVFLYDMAARHVVEGSAKHLALPTQGGVKVRVTANGRAAALTGTTGISLVLREDFGKWAEFNRGGVMFAGQDENQFFQNATTYTAAGTAQDVLKADGTGPWLVPATHDGYFVAASLKSTKGKGPLDWPPYLEVFVNRDVSRSRLKGLPDYLPETADLLKFPHGPAEPLDRSIFLFPRARVLAIIPVTRDKLVLRRADLN